MLFLSIAQKQSKKTEATYQTSHIVRALCSVTLAMLCGSSSELINCLCWKRPNVLQFSDIPHSITVQYWRIMNKSIFYIEDFLFHNVHRSLFLSTQWYLMMINTSIASFQLSFTYQQIHEKIQCNHFFSHHPTLSVIPPLSLPHP